MTLHALELRRYELCGLIMWTELVIEGSELCLVEGLRKVLSLLHVELRLLEAGGCHITYALHNPPCSCHYCPAGTGCCCIEALQPAGFTSVQVHSGPA